MTYSPNNTSVLYERIQNDLIEKINSGFFIAGDKLPSENELCKIYNVSRITATKALTELSLNGYIYRIQGKGSYVSNSNTKSSNVQIGPKLIEQTTPSKFSRPIKIALILHSAANYHSGQIIESVINTLPYPNFFVSTIFNSSPEIEDYAIKSIESGNHDGMILFPSEYEFCSNKILRLFLNKFPMVLIDRTFPSINCNYVLCDNVIGSKLAFEHLYNKGHQKIGFVAPFPVHERMTKIRYDTYANEMSIKCNSLPIVYDNVSNSLSEFNDKLVLDIKEKRVTAVITSNVKAAKYVMDVLQKNNLKIPDDLSIVTFDKNDTFNHLSRPIAYVEQQSYNIGKLAAEIIKSIFDKEESNDKKQIILNPYFVEEDSVADIN